VRCHRIALVLILMVISLWTAGVPVLDEVAAQTSPIKQDTYIALPGPAVFITVHSARGGNVTGTDAYGGEITQPLVRADSIDREHIGAHELPSERRNSQGACRFDREDGAGARGEGAVSQEKAKPKVRT
jgi:hypothetical protein